MNAIIRQILTLWAFLLATSLGCNKPGTLENNVTYEAETQSMSPEDEAELDKRIQGNINQSVVEYAGIRIIAWNVESDGSDPAVIAEQLAEMEADLICLSELPREALESGPLHDFLTKNGNGTAFGSTGRNDRLSITVTSSKLQLWNAHDLHEFNGVDLGRGGHRAPFMALVRRSAFGDFWIVNNHLARGDATYRKLQAETLRDWAAAQLHPVVFVGDYNMDYDFHSKSGNDAFRAFLSDGTIKWIQPKKFIDTNWSDRGNDSKDDYPDSTLRSLLAKPKSGM